MANYDGLTRNAWPGTWSPSSNHPIVLDTEIRGGLRYVAGSGDDSALAIPGQRLQEGMLIYVDSSHGTFNGGDYYQYNLLGGEARDGNTGGMPNAAGNWTRIHMPVQPLDSANSPTFAGLTLSDLDVDSININGTTITGLSAPSGNDHAANKLYVDGSISTAVAAGNNLTISDGSTTDVVDLAGDTLTFTGGTGITSAVTNDNLTLSITNTGVIGAAYGSTTQIPVLTINAQGQVDSAGTVAISTDLLIAGDTGTDTVTSGDTLTFTGTDPVQTAITNNDVAISIDDASTTAKGIASFSSDNFSVSSGAVTIKTGGVANVEMVNSSLTIGSTEVALGATSTVLAGLTQIDVDNIRIMDNTIASSAGVLYIDPNPIDSDGGDVIIRGNLTVQGLQTIINSTTMSVNDLNLVLADSAGNGTAADGAGITIGGAGFSGTKPTILWDNATSAWDYNFGLNMTAGINDANTITFNDVKIMEAIEDHLVSNFFQAGEGIDLTYVDGSNQLTVAAELATLTNPGVANFDSDQMTVTSGLVTITTLDGGVF